MSGRRAREDDKERQAIPDKDRQFVREIVLECEARLMLAMKSAGIDDADLHRSQHDMFDKVWPEVQDTLLPYVREKLAVTKKWSDRLDKVTDQMIMWVVGAAMLFMLYCVYYGATEAIARMAD